MDEYQARLDALNLAVINAVRPETVIKHAEIYYGFLMQTKAEVIKVESGAKRK